ncbi:hypothetical protein P7K49_036441 [Saguinus oedipus]|uniref:Uncharacterized protein n=1 Tax=Saguinus oedipus TaxID=9490 RepID=A0ABQ9TK53_SAGOE|nr:hypothetical protein P7K49_036441 [Saguinus oedipus]
MDLERSSSATGSPPGLPALHGSPRAMFIKLPQAEPGGSPVWSDGRGPTEGHSQAVRCLRFSPDGKWLASAADDHTVKVAPPSLTWAQGPGAWGLLITTD